jgi:hypothetical protein
MRSRGMKEKHAESTITERVGARSVMKTRRQEELLQERQKNVLGSDAAPISRRIAVVTT